MSKKNKPIALWKSIVGVSASSTILLSCGLYFLIRVFNNMAVFEIVIVSVVAAVGLIFLLINLLSLKQTREYLANKAQEPVAPSGNKPQSKEKTELLHRLLEEGKITIEEYDRLMGE